MSITPEILDKLKQILKERQVITGGMIGADYAHDELPGGKAYTPEAVCEVSSTEEVAEVLALCSDYNVPVTVRGAGTGLVGGSVPIQGGIVLSMKSMNAILGYSEESMTLKVQPGALLEEVKAYADSIGMCYPVDPGEKTASIGGNVATNAGGPCAVKYGVTRDYVAGMTTVLADGTVLNIGGETGKNNSGYNLLQLIVGSEGTLAVITEVTLKLIPKVRFDTSFIMPFTDTESCMKAAMRIRKEHMEPAVLEYIDTDIVEYAGKVTGNPYFPVDVDGDRVGASLLITLEGNSEENMDSKMEALAELSEELECLDVLVVDSPTLKRDMWAAHDAFHISVEAAAKSSDELNMTVPAKALPEFVGFLKGTGISKGLGVYIYAHVGDGGLHAYFVSDEARDIFAPLMVGVAQAAYAKCAELGGNVSSEHGIGYAKREYLKASLGETGYALMGRIKAAFDPNGILNPGKVV